MFVVKSIDETIDIIKNNFNNYPLNTIKIKLEDALNYVNAKDIFAREDIPHFNRSIVDGYAVDFESVKLASSTSPVILKYIGEVLMGKKALKEVTKDSTVYVPTGGVLPVGANSVQMIEHTEELGDDIFINKPVSKWENVFLKGSDISKDSLVLKKNTLITPLVIGALKSLGIQDILVFEKLKATVISTGDELVKDKEILEVGEIRDINTYTISNFLKNKNVEIKKTVMIYDDFKKYKEEIIKGLTNTDIVFSSGGSSVGDKDYTYRILESIGAEILVHGINIKPGKPTIIAKYNDKLFLGLPGQPTSAYFVLNTFINEIISTIYNLENILPLPYFMAKLDTNISSPTGRRMYQLVKISKKNNELIATPLFAKSGMINSLKEANGYTIIPDSLEGIMSGEMIKVYRLGD